MEGKNINLKPLLNYKKSLAGSSGLCYRNETHLPKFTLHRYSIYATAFSFESQLLVLFPCPTNLTSFG